MQIRHQQKDTVANPRQQACYSCGYSAIVPDQGRTGRDLSLRIYYHEKGYETIAVLTIVRQLLSK
ncbi:MAG TPA: hypothetical protein VIG72_10700 [Pontibacter sp.]